jgi:hypothetical protein
MTGAERIAAERYRQIKIEGWGAAHDAEHVDGELALAAVCYAAPVPLYVKDETPNGAIEFSDPWTRGWDKRPVDDMGSPRPPPVTERIRMLEKAGALIAAEIDRLLRAAPGAAEPKEG